MQISDMSIPESNMIIVNVYEHPAYLTKSRKRARGKNTSKKTSGNTPTLSTKPKKPEHAKSTQKLDSLWFPETPVKEGICEGQSQSSLTDWHQTDCELRYIADELKRSTSTLSIDSASSAESAWNLFYSCVFGQPIIRRRCFSAGAGTYKFRRDDDLLK